MDRWLSGRKHTFAKGACLKRAPRVRIPPGPPVNSYGPQQPCRAFFCGRVEPIHGPGGMRTLPEARVRMQEGASRPACSREAQTGMAGGNPSRSASQLNRPAATLPGPFCGQIGLAHGPGGMRTLPQARVRMQEGALRPACSREAHAGMAGRGACPTRSRNRPKAIIGVSSTRSVNFPGLH